MAPKDVSDNSSDDGDHDFDEKDIEALAAMESEDDDGAQSDEESHDTEFRNGSATGALMSNIEHIETGNKPSPIEYDDEELDIKALPQDAVVICRDTKTNYLFRAVLYLMPGGSLVYALVTDKEKAWKLALHVHKNKKNVFKKKDEDTTIKRSVATGKPWAEGDFATAPPTYCTPSALYKTELRKANAKAAKAKAALLSPPVVDTDDAASTKSTDSPAPKKPTKPASTNAPKKRPATKKRVEPEPVPQEKSVKRQRIAPTDMRTLTAPTDHPLWEFIDAAKVAMDEANLVGSSLVE